MNTAFAFWFYGMIICIIAAVVLYGVDYINKRWFEHSWADELELWIGGSVVGTFWCAMCVFVWIFG